MRRHVLTPLFNPGSLLVISDRQLPVEQSLPASLAASVTHLSLVPGLPLQLPDMFAGLGAGSCVDLALICVPSAQLERVLLGLATRPPRAAIILPHDTADGRPELTQSVCRRWAQQHDCVLIGPNSLGLQRPVQQLNLSLHPALARAGRVALVSQSASIMASVLDWADDAHIGFSTALALGDEPVGRLAEVLEFLAMDSDTDSIALYVEEVGFGREFMSALRAAASVKPVVVIKVGRALASVQEDAAFDAALRRAGAVRVRYFVQLFSALKVLVHLRRPKGSRLALLSNGSGPPQLAIDLVVGGGPFRKADFSVHTRMALGKLLEPGRSVFNPVITHQPLTKDLIRDLLQTLINETGVDGVLVMLAPDARANLDEVVQELTTLSAKVSKPVITCLLGDAQMRPLRRRLDDAGTPAFRTPESAADAFGILASYHYNQQLLLQMQSPHAEGQAPRLARALQMIDAARAQGRNKLSGHEIAALLESFGASLRVGVPTSETVALSQVPLRLLVEPDLHFGPVISLSAGGVMAKVSGPGDGMDLAPLNRYLARQLLERSQVWRKALSGHVSVLAHEALLTLLECLSNLVAELPDVERIVLDPMYLDDQGPYVAQASIVLHTLVQRPNPQVNGYPHMAIHPYPYRWVQTLAFGGSREGVLRPIRPEDAHGLQTFIQGLSERSRYMRFVSMMRELTPRMLARYTQIDYHRELALVVTTRVPNPADRGRETEIIIGLAHYLRHADGQGAEYALVIGDDWQRLGLGGCLMKKLLVAAREQGLEYIDGVVLTENRPMLELMKQLGFVSERDTEDSSVRRVWFDLTQAA